jgi:hypothetical protein
VAVGIQRRTREINVERSEEVPIGVHIGINSGIAAVGATKIQAGGGDRWTYTASGPTTNIAARIGALGEEIAITKQTLDRLGDGFVIESVGEKALKNVKEPVPVFRITGAVAGSEEARAEPETASEAEVPAEFVPETPGPGRFVVTGIVRESQTGRPLDRLEVRAFDKDLLSDDFLGTATTDATGRYQIGFSAESFRDLFERHPDLYLRVFDAEGQELASTIDAVRWNAGPVEQIDVEVAGPGERGA